MTSFYSEAEYWKDEFPSLRQPLDPQQQFSSWGVSGVPVAITKKRQNKVTIMWHNMGLGGVIQQTQMRNPTPNRSMVSGP
jgi:hypothetical protein